MDIFVARLHGGQTEIANALIANNVSLRGFALLHIVISMFKINGKYRSGYQGERYSRKYFKENVKHVFKQDIEDENAPLFNALMNTSEVESTMSG